MAKNKIERVAKHDYQHKVFSEYEKMLSAYVQMVIMMEAYVEETIAVFFINNTEDQNSLIGFVLSDINFTKKIQVVIDLLNRKEFVHLYTPKIKSMFEGIKSINSKRNKLAHAVPVVYAKTITDTIENISVKKHYSRKEEFHISNKELKDDDDKHWDYMHQFAILLNKIYELKWNMEDPYDRF